mgnify:CR=1 FL=1
MAAAGTAQNNTRVRTLRGTSKRNGILQPRRVSPLDIGGANLDIVYASGDQNFADHSQNGFKLDINSELGLILFLITTIVLALSKLLLLRLSRHEGAKT